MKIAIQYADGEIKEISQKLGGDLVVLYEDYMEESYNLVFEGVLSFERLNHYEHGPNDLTIEKGAILNEDGSFNKYVLNDGGEVALLIVFAKNLRLAKKHDN